MAWFNETASPIKQSAARNVNHSFDIPLKIRVRGVAEAVHSTLLHIAVAVCRLRSWMPLERGTAISFDWRLGSGKVLQMSGVVAARYPTRDGSIGFEYAIALEELPEADSDALAREAALLARRTASARNFDTSLVDVAQFTGYRVPDDFTIGYRPGDNGAVPKVGRACDVTGNGLRIRCDHHLRAGELLTLTFALPDRKNLRHRFPQLKLKAKVLGTVKDSRRRDAYEVHFVDVDGKARTELARYISASQKIAPPAP